MKRALLVLLWLGVCNVCGAVEEILLFSYQQKPPYVLDGDVDHGLYADLARQLNNRLPAYHFVMREIPRKRLDRLLSQHELNGLIIGADPAWFSQSPGLTSSAAFIDDANVLVSRANGDISKVTLDNLDGKRLGLVAGHYYPELNEALSRGHIEVQEGVSEAVNLQRLQKGWVDATVIGARTLEYFQQQDPALKTQLYVQDATLYHYQRHLLVPERYVRLLPELDEVIEGLPQDPAWQRQLQGYR